MSNSLRQRLGAGPEPQLHPDSDLLTAYIERSLAPAEQADMVRHLAACSWCREVVALSLPEAQVLPAAAPARGRWAWFWLPTLRWSAVAATVLIGATLLVEKPWKSRTGPAPVTDMAAQKVVAPFPPPVTASAPAAESANAIPAGRADVAAVPSQTSGLQASGGQPSPAAIGSLAKKQTNIASIRRDDTAAPGTVSSFAASGLRGRNQPDTGSVASSFSGVAPPSPVITADAGLVSAPAPKPEVTDQNTRFLARTIPITPDSIRNSALAVTFGDEKAKSDSPAAYSAGAQGGSRVFTFPRKIITASKDKMAGASPSRTPGMAMMEDKENARMKAEAAPPPERLHWSISPDGKLIKSADLNVWHEVYPQKDDLLFRVVVAEGHDVWAGGSHLTLIHSWNGGVDWKKMKLGEAAAGDITDIVIGNGDVQVKTSNDQTWVSQDGGVTWVPLKQPAPAQPK